MREGVGSIVGGLKQSCVFGCSLGWELWRYMISILDSTLVTLVEAPVSLVFSLFSFTTWGLSWQLSTPLDRLKLIIFLCCWNFREKRGRLKTDLDYDRIRAKLRSLKLLSVLSILSITIAASRRAFSNPYTPSPLLSKPTLSAMRLKKRRMLVAFMAIIGSISVGLIGLHIHTESAGSVINSTAASRSGDRHETSGGSEFGDAIGDRREYKITLSVLQLPSLSLFSSLL